MDMSIEAMLLGFAALGFGMAGHQHSCTKTALYFLTGASLFWGLHFLAIGEPAFIAAFVNTGRNLLSARINSARQRSILVMTCLCFSVSMAAPYVSSWVDILPLLAISLISAGIIMRQAFVMHKGLILSGELVWLGYALIIGSAPLAIANAVFMGAICIALRRHYLRPAPAAVAV